MKCLKLLSLQGENQLIAPALPLAVVITSNGNPMEGQGYSLTCSVMGAESLPPSTVEHMYRWNRNVNRSPLLSSSTTLDFTPLARSDDGTYICTVTITSPLLNNTRTAMSGRTLTVTRKSVHRSLILEDININDRCYA